MPRPILVVDDDDSIRAMLADILEHEGYPVVTARDGMEALAAVERAVPSLILVDVLMPMLDGRDLVTHLRDLGVDVPVVFMSASHEIVRQAGVSADAYITKPFELEMLLDTVARLAGEPAFGNVVSVA